MRHLCVVSEERANVTSGTEMGDKVKCELLLFVLGLGWIVWCGVKGGCGLGDVRREVWS